MSAHPRLGRVAAIVLRQAHLMRGSPARVLPLFAWVAVDIVLWGLITRWLATLTTEGPRLLLTLLGAVLLWDFFIRVMQGVTLTFFEDVWTRNFLNLFATPLTLGEYVGGLLAASLLTSAVGLAVMVLLSSLVFGLDLLAYGALLLPFLAVLVVFGLSLGLLACALVLRLGPASEWLVWPIPALLSPFAGVFYPLSSLPGWMQAVGRLLPPAHVFEAMRALARGEPASAAALGLGLGLALVDLLVAFLVFTAVYRGAVRSGLLARYSAESGA